jgi:hypothetical protein
MPQKISHLSEPEAIDDYMTTNEMVRRFQPLLGRGCE